MLELYISVLPSIQQCTKGILSIHHGFFFFDMGMGWTKSLDVAPGSTQNMPSHYALLLALEVHSICHIGIGFESLDVTNHADLAPAYVSTNPYFLDQTLPSCSHHP